MSKMAKKAKKAKGPKRPMKVALVNLWIKQTNYYFMYLRFRSLGLGAIE